MSKQFDPLSMSKPSDKWVMSYVIQVELFSHYQSIIWPTPQILQLVSWSMSKQFNPLSMSKPSDKWVMSYVIQVELFSHYQSIIWPTPQILQLVSW